MTLLAFCLAYAGLCCLSLAMPRHFADVMGGAASGWEQNLMRTGGWSMLAVSLMLCSLASNAGVGCLVWLGMLSGAGLLLIFLLPYRPRLALHFAIAGTGAALLLLPFSATV